MSVASEFRNNPSIEINRACEDLVHKAYGLSAREIYDTLKSGELECPR